MSKIKGIKITGVHIDKLFDEIEIRKPNIVLLELEKVKVDIFFLLKLIKQKYPQLKIIVLSDLSDINKARKLLSADLDGYLDKSVTKDELRTAAIKVYKGEKFYCQKVSEILKEMLNTQNEAPILSKRELEILNYIAQGLSNKEIGEKLFLSEYTVLTHRRNIMKKLKVNSTPQLIIKSIKHGYINID
ncbi:MAG: response regulator transcription factor [Melioribacter sp.]|nr:response regulator transcription factor [Melioribacter sp.]